MGNASFYWGISATLIEFSHFKAQSAKYQRIFLNKAFFLSTDCGPVGLIGVLAIVFLAFSKPTHQSLQQSSYQGLLFTPNPSSPDDEGSRRFPLRFGVRSSAYKTAGGARKGDKLFSLTGSFGCRDPENSKARGACLFLIY
jgi:hypothetical protein